MTSTGIGPDLLSIASSMQTDVVLETLHEKGMASIQTAEELIEAALMSAESDHDAAERWLDVADGLSRSLGNEPLLAQISYTRARVLLFRGEPTAAEAAIRTAQTRWQNARETVALARSYMGLTQVLALQGRYQEAQESIQRAIAGLPDGSLASAQAHRNYANLLGRQERHQEALAHFDRAGQIYSTVLEAAPHEREQSRLQSELAHLSLNRANALMSLDRLQEAETVLIDSLSTFSREADTLNVGRVQTNLGSLYLRSGRYTEALAQLEGARQTLLGHQSAEEASDLRRQADVLHLEQANTYLALNLLPEAALELDRAIRLFESANQPRELGQALYTSAVALMRSGDDVEARKRLLTAQAIFEELNNRFWHNRIQLALAHDAYRRGEFVEALSFLKHLRTGIEERADEEGAKIQFFDRGLMAEILLLSVRVSLELGELENATFEMDRFEQNLDGEKGGSSLPGPHIQVELNHLRGRLALAQGKREQAMDALLRAEAQLETIEIGLPLEEIRMAYLDDKSELVVDILEAELAGPDSGRAQIERIFEIMERSRARTLLDQLAAESPENDGEGAALRRQLHWLYNQILDPEQSPAQYEARRAQIQMLELRLQQQAWSSATTGARRDEAPCLDDLQQALEPDERTLIYWVSRRRRSEGEVMALLVGPDEARLERSLTTIPELDRLVADFRYQIGRAELGYDYLQRQGRRLRDRVNKSLFALHRALLSPFASELKGRKLQIVPHDLLHGLPFHAFWDGSAHLLADTHVSYAPSVTFALRPKRPETVSARRSWAGLALDDPLIPGAEEEVLRVAAHFGDANLLLGERADREGLRGAASQAHILHLATHGLFRPDNPLFSALKLSEGWIDVREIERMPLSARLVVLSACESGAGRIRGRDELIGLVRGFLSAGAETVVASLWKVHDRSGSELMARFYTELTGGVDAAEALRRSQRYAIEEGQHPYFWAPFYTVTNLRSCR